VRAIKTLGTGRDGGMKENEMAGQTWRTAAEDSAEIRAKLKQKGWSARDVSVRTENFAGGSAIEITIKSPQVKIDVVKKIASEKESISRCEITGDILAGSNRYVNVSRSENCKAVMAAPFTEAVLRAMDKLDKMSEGTHVNVTETRVTMSREQHMIAVWTPDGKHLGRGWSTEVGMLTFLVACAHRGVPAR